MPPASPDPSPDDPSDTLPGYPKGEPKPRGQATGRPLFGQSGGPAPRGRFRLAAALSALWLAMVMVVGFALPTATRAVLLPQGGLLSWLLTAIGLAMPVALIWVVAATARSLSDLRDEAARLKITIDGLRQAQNAQLRGTFTPGLRAPGQTGARPGGASGSARIPAPAERKPAAEVQPALALGPAQPDEAPPIDLDTAIRALNFPENSDDADGLRALRAALAHRALAKLIRAAQDVLTLLSQDGIYMDDLAENPAGTELWRRFASGERGRALSALGAVGAPETLAHLAGRMRADTIFRDAAHHFLRQFDRSLAEFDRAADDADIAALAQTRTARAFMLLGRVAGTFD